MKMEQTSFNRDKWGTLTAKYLVITAQFRGDKPLRRRRRSFRTRASRLCCCRSWTPFRCPCSRAVLCPGPISPNPPRWTSADWAGVRRYDGGETANGETHKQQRLSRQNSVENGNGTAVCRNNNTS